MKIQRRPRSVSSLPGSSFPSSHLRPQHLCTGPHSRDSVLRAGDAPPVAFSQHPHPSPPPIPEPHLGGIWITLAVQSSTCLGQRPTCLTTASAHPQIARRPSSALHLQLGPRLSRPAHFRHAHRVPRACAGASLLAGEDPSPAPSWAKSSFLQRSQQPLLVRRGPDFQDHVLPSPCIGSQDKNLIHPDTDILTLPPPDTRSRISASPSVGVSVFPERPPVPLPSSPGPAWPPLYVGLI